MSDGAKAAPDWARIEIDYRAGIKPLRQIAAEHGITHGAVNKRAVRDEWVRDLGAKIRQRAESKVSKAAVSATVSKDRAVTEKMVVEANAEAIVRVRLAHRSDISRARKLAVALLAELEAQTGGLEELAALGEMLRDDSAAGRDRLNEAYQAVISLPERTKTLKALAEALKTLIYLEREAFGITPVEPDDPGSGRSPNPEDAAATFAWLCQQGARR